MLNYETLFVGHKFKRFINFTILKINLPCVKENDVQNRSSSETLLNFMIGEILAS